MMSSMSKQDQVNGLIAQLKQLTDWRDPQTMNLLAVVMLPVRTGAYESVFGPLDASRGGVEPQCANEIRAALEGWIDRDTKRVKARLIELGVDPES